MFKHKKGYLFALITLVLVTAIAGSIIVSSQNNQNRVEVSSPTGVKQKPNDLKVPPPQQNQYKSSFPQAIPDEIAYGQIFKHLELLGKKADDEEKIKGKDGKKLRNLYKEMAKLDERQARILDKIASDTNRELNKLDERAKQIVDQIRSQTPNRKIERGQRPPLPPQELFDLSKKRKDLIFQAVNNLRQNFGEAEFVRFSQFINEKVKTGIRKESNPEVRKGGLPK